MKDETKMHQDAGRTNHQIVLSFMNQKAQLEKAKAFMERDMELGKQILATEIKFGHIVNEKPEYLLKQEYMDLIIEQNKLVHEIKMVDLKDKIATHEANIKNISKEITRLSRNCVQKPTALANKEVEGVKQNE